MLKIMKLRNSIFILLLVGVTMSFGCGNKKPLNMQPLMTNETVPKLDPSLPFKQRVYEKVTSLGTIYFNFDKSIIKTAYRTILEDNTMWLKNNPNKEILIEGHCDNRGTEEYNIALGERRSESVRKYYIALGIEKTNIEILSWGEEKPVDIRNNMAAWTKNRRVETLIRIK